MINIKIITKDLNNIITNDIWMKELRRLTLQPYSGMNQELDNFVRLKANGKEINALALIAEHDSKIVGWALFSRVQSNYAFSHQFDGIKNCYNSGHGVLFEVYVDPKMRSKGIGSKLLKKASTLANGSPLCIVPHDGVSQKFYTKNLHLKLKSLTYHL